MRSFRWRDELGAGRSTVESFRKLYPTAMEDALPPRVADDPQFSFRDEANALTALTFRNGFLEELHAGEGAISDRDIRRLMVESSEALARQLRLKARDPARYRTELRAYHDR